MKNTWNSNINNHNKCNKFYLLCVLVKKGYNSVCVMLSIVDKYTHGLLFYLADEIFDSITL
jgi:hypothetical protein